MNEADDQTVKDVDKSLILLEKSDEAALFPLIRLLLGIHIHLSKSCGKCGKTLFFPQVRYLPIR